MKRKFTLLAAALMLLAFITPPLRAVGQSTITVEYNDTFDPALPTASGSVNTNSTAHTDQTANNFAFKEQGIYKGSSNNYLMFAQNKGFLYNTADLGTITSVAVTYSSGTSTTAMAGVYFGNTEQSTYTTTNNSTIAGQSQTDTWNNNTAGYGYFQLSTSNKNCQITQIVITYTSGGGNTPTLTSLTCSGTPAITTYEVGDYFVPTGLTVTAHYSDNSTADVTSDVVWTPAPFTSTATTQVTGTYGGQTVTVSSISVTAASDPNIVLNKDNSPFSSTNTSSNTNTETVTLDEIEYQNYGGYIYSNYLSFNRNINGYLGNNTLLCGNIKKIVVSFSTATAYSSFTMYEGAAALEETTTIAANPKSSGNTHTATYMFSRNKGYFKYKLTTTGNYCNINSISIYLEDCTNPAITVSTNSLEGFTYIEGHGPSAAQSFTVSGENLTTNLSMSLGDNSDFEISQSENSSYTNAIALAPTSSAVSSTTIYARLKENKTKGNYSGTITLTSTDATTKTVSLSGSVTGQTYTLSDESGEHGSITFDPSTPVEAGTHVTLTATPATDDYYFNGTWSFFKEDLTNVTENIVFVTGETNVIEMPAYNLLVDAGFVQKPTHTTTCTVTGSGTVTPAPASTYEGQIVTLTIAPATGWDLSSISATYVDGNSATQTLTLSGSGNTRTFTMPNYNVTVEATFLSNTFEGNFVLFTGEMTEGDYLLVYDGGAMNNTVSSSRFGITNVTPVSNIISNPSNDIVWHIAPSATVNNYWTIYNAKETKYVNAAASSTTVSLVDTPNNNSQAQWGVTKNNNTYSFRCKANESSTARYIGRNSDYGFANYQSGVELTLYKYTPERTITFNGNGGTYNDATTYTQTVLDGIATNLNPNQFTNGSSAFAGWSTTADGDVVYANGAPITVTGDITLYAKWSVGYTITYITNGITESTTTSVAAGNEIGVLIEPTAANIPNGYTFMGWYNGDLALTQTAPNYITETVVPTSNMTLKAVFATAKSEPSTEAASLTLKAGDVTWGSGSGYKSGTATKDGIAFTIENGMSSNDYIQLRTGDGRVYNTTPFIAITSITTTVGVNSILVYEGTAANPSSTTVSGSSNVYTFSDNMNYFAIKGDNKFTQVYFTINYVKPSTITTYSNYCTSVRILTLLDEATTYNVPCSIDPENGFIIESGHTLTVDVLGNTNASNLLIEDGGQLICNNDVAATVEKNITGYGDDNTTKTGWNFIASPIVAEEGIAPTATMLSNTYDLYQLNNTVWENYKPTTGNVNPEFNLFNGKGYLYANSEDVTLEFAGAIKPYAANANTVTLADGWNLVGNPYTRNVYSSLPYYKITTTDGVDAITAVTVASEAIAPCTGIVVNSTGTSSVAFNTSAGEWATNNNGNLQMTVAQQVTNRGTATIEDNAIVSFNEGNQLEKFYFGSPKANIYIQQGAEEYAIVNAEAQGEMPVSFRANEDGQYTLTVKPEGVEMNYLHLVDNMTGMDVDLLQTPSYTFNAKTTDYESRFRLVFAANNEDGVSTGSTTFAFFSNGSWIINNEGEATLQVIDLNGRILSSETINGSVSTSLNATTGIYMMRLISGDNVKTQKVVVR